MCIVVVHIRQSIVLCRQARSLLNKFQYAERSPLIFLLLRSEELHSGSSCSDDVMTMTIQCIKYSLVYNEDALVPTTVNTSSDLVSNPEQL